MMLRAPKTAQSAGSQTTQVLDTSATCVRALETTSRVTVRGRALHWFYERYVDPRM